MAKDFTKVYDENERLKAENAKLKDELTCEECEQSLVDPETGVTAFCITCWNLMVTKLRAEIDQYQAEIDKLETELKGKDELLFAYESVRAPVNPLYAENAKLKRKLKKCVCPHCGFGFERKEKDGVQDESI